MAKSKPNTGKKVAIKKTTPKKKPLRKTTVAITSTKKKIIKKTNSKSKGFQTFGTSIKLETPRKIYIENIFIYKQNGFDNVREILTDIEEPVNKSRFMTLNVDGESNDYLKKYLTNISIKGGLGLLSLEQVENNDTPPYFYDVIFEDFEGWNRDKVVEYSKYLNSLLNFEFEYDESKSDLKDNLIAKTERLLKDDEIVVVENESFIIIKFSISYN